MERIKEHLQGINSKFVEEKRVEEQKQLEEEEQIKETFRGMIADTKINYIPVTEASFIEWETAFRAEMRQKKLDKEAADPPLVQKMREEMGQRLNGKQFFLQRMQQNMNIDEEVEDDGDGDFNELLD